MISRAIRQLLALVVIALLPAVVSGLWQLRWGTADQREVTRAETERWHEPVLWVDARTREQFDRGHAPGAVLLNETEWNECVPAFLDAWKPEMRIVVYCDTPDGSVGREVARRIHDEFDIKDVWVLKGR